MRSPKLRNSYVKTDPWEFYRPFLISTSFLFLFKIINTIAIVLLQMFIFPYPRGRKLKILSRGRLGMGRGRREAATGEAIPNLPPQLKVSQNKFSFF